MSHGNNNVFAFTVVIFVLLVIVGCACYY
ncbi:YjcZ family sporulation protein [Alteribacter natronophilus]|nr:YjcZ family sporulation protein [Alteribacter natronophilus]TMW71876.1 YjcZ family sporulation protein [Alteribacter natronophilus]